jgi:5'-nucleotidase
MKPARALLARVVAAAAVFGVAACAVRPGVQAPETAAPFAVKILAFNDFHGNLESPGSLGQNSTVPEAARPAVGGADFLGAYVARYRALNPLHVVVGAGDFIGASPLVSALFHDEPTVETLNRIGLEFTAVGNHEFDKGADELRRLQRGGCKSGPTGPDATSCRGHGSVVAGRFDGARYQWLSANVIDRATGQPLLAPYGLKSFNGVPVAFIGMTLEGTPGVVTPTGVAGLNFIDEASTVNALVPILRRQGVEAIVVLVHQGGVGAGLSDINGCVGDLAGSDLAPIVAGLDDAVDLVISAHTHAAYNCSATTVDDGRLARPTGLPNRLGRKVPVTSAGAFGRVLTDIDVLIDPRTRDIAQVLPTNRLVDRSDPAAQSWVAAHPEIGRIVAAYKADAAPLAAQVIATIRAPVSNAVGPAGAMPAGELIADAQLQATQPAALGGAAMAFMNAGGVRNPGFVNPAGTYPYDLSYGDTFTVQPFGNSLVTMSLTTQQIKDVLEQQFPGCLGQGRQRILQVSHGLRIAWNADRPTCQKIVDVSFTPMNLRVTPALALGPAERLVTGGAVQNPGKTFRVTVNNFMASGGDGFTVFNAGQDRLGGAQDIDALVAYLSGYKAPAAPYDPGAEGLLGQPRVMALP